MLAFSKQTCGKEWFNEMKYGHKIRYYFNAAFATKVSEFELHKSIADHTHIPSDWPQLLGFHHSQCRINEFKFAHQIRYMFDH